MAVFAVTSYTFDPRAGTVTLTGLDNPDLKGIRSIRVRGTLIYLPTDARNSSLVGKVLTLPKGSVSRAWSASEPLTIMYDDSPPPASGGSGGGGMSLVKDSSTGTYRIESAS